MFRGVGLGGRKLRCSCTRGQRSPALVAELVRRRIGCAAGGAERIQARAALSAELHVYRILVPAAGTMHPGSSGARAG
jgi:hypothetical protein